MLPIKKILGVKIDDLPKSDVLRKVSGWLSDSSSTSKIIVTPGPEFLVTAQNDLEFKKILNAADLSVPDGFGLQLYGGVRHRVAGVGLMKLFCELSALNGWTMGLLGGAAGVAEETASILIKRYHNIKIRFVLDGVRADRATEAGKLPSECDLLFVALGHPKQEKLLWRLRGQYRVGMGVGGAFDYISGRALPAPKWVSGLGLEWLWRLFTQFSRSGRLVRILKATLVFPFLLLRERTGF